jgi:transcriptional regulator of arginine metabolism
MTPIQHPFTKNSRLAEIRHLLTSSEVGTQQQLRDTLAKEGFIVTQATLSRDLEELGAYKSHGEAIYKLPHSEQLPDFSQLDKVLAGLIVGVAQTGSFIIIHTPIGAAQYAASIIDAQPSEDILGTVAGNDTILLIITGEDVAQSLVGKFLELAETKTRSGSLIKRIFPKYDETKR